jgi:hypothetical protein
MARTPKGWMFTAGLAALAVVAALAATSVKRAPQAATDTYDIEADSCFRYGKLECCIKE